MRAGSPFPLPRYLGGQGKDADTLREDIAVGITVAAAVSAVLYIDGEHSRINPFQHTLYIEALVALLMHIQANRPSLAGKQLAANG